MTTIQECQHLRIIKTRLVKLQPAGGPQNAGSAPQALCIFVRSFLMPARAAESTMQPCRGLKDSFAYCHSTAVCQLRCLVRVRVPSCMVSRMCRNTQRYSLGSGGGRLLPISVSTSPGWTAKATMPLSGPSCRLSSAVIITCTNQCMKMMQQVSQAHDVH